MLGEELIIRNAVVWQQLKRTAKRLEVLCVYFALLFLWKRKGFARFGFSCQPYKGAMRATAYGRVPPNVVLSQLPFEFTEIHIT